MMVRTTLAPAAARAVTLKAATMITVSATKMRRAEGTREKMAVRVLSVLPPEQRERTQAGGVAVESNPRVNQIQGVRRWPFRCAHGAEKLVYYGLDRR